MILLATKLLKLGEPPPLRPSKTPGGGLWWWGGNREGTHSRIGD